MAIPLLLHDQEARSAWSQEGENREHGRGRALRTVETYWGPGMLRGLGGYFTCSIFKSTRTYKVIILISFYMQRA